MSTTSRDRTRSRSPITKWMRLNRRVSQPSAASDFNARRQRAENSRRCLRFTIRDIGSLSRRKPIPRALTSALRFPLTWIRARLSKLHKSNTTLPTQTACAYGGARRARIPSTIYHRQLLNLLKRVVPPRNREHVDQQNRGYLKFKGE
jgi:hypothetical protein